METFPILTTKNLTLRRMRLSDLPALIDGANNRKITDQIINFNYPFTEEDAVIRFNFVLNGFKQKERFVFAITQHDNDELIGEIGIHLDKSNNSAQFGYWLNEKQWGKGIITEALGAILQFGFEVLKLNKIYATHYPDNPASGKVIQKNKMIKEAELKDHYLIDGQYRSVIQYRLTKSEYEAFTSL